RLHPVDIANAAARCRLVPSPDRGLRAHPADGPAPRLRQELLEGAGAVAGDGGAALRSSDGPSALVEGLYGQPHVTPRSPGARRRGSLVEQRASALEPPR